MVARHPVRTLVYIEPGDPPFAFEVWANNFSEWGTITVEAQAHLSLLILQVVMWPLLRLWDLLLCFMVFLWDMIEAQPKGSVCQTSVQLLGSLRVRFDNTLKYLSDGGERSKDPLIVLYNSYVPVWKTVYIGRLLYFCVSWIRYTCIGTDISMRHGGGVSVFCFYWFFPQLQSTAEI